jgi:hypothetical protein
MTPIFGAAGPRSALALDPGVSKRVPQRVNRLEREIAPVDLDNDAGLGVVDQSWGCHFRVGANRRHFRWLGWRAPVSACYFPISVSAPIGVPGATLEACVRGFRLHRAPITMDGTVMSGRHHDPRRIVA